MTQDKTVYQRKTRNLCTHLDRTIYKIMAQEPEKEWYLSEIQDYIENEWGIRPYRATLLRHAMDFYGEHHIPLVYKISFNEDKYKLNTLLSAEKWQEYFKPRQKGRPRKQPRTINESNL
jgi:hypothetical protein